MGGPSSQVAEHLQSPRNAGRLASPTGHGRSDLDGRSPYVEVDVMVQGGLVHEIAFRTFGCGYLIACCSVATELVRGASESEARVLTASQVLDAIGGLPPDREFCAELAAKAIRLAVEGNAP